MLRPQTLQNNCETRPVIFDYPSVERFFSDLLLHYKQVSDFSIRHRLDGVNGCSPALVSRVLSGKRRLTRDQLPVFAEVFDLTAAEVDVVDDWLKGKAKQALGGSKPSHIPKNHILSSWLHMYVKDLVHLKEFKLDARTLHKMLMNIASVEQVERSIGFLLKEGFWRKAPGGQVVAEEPLLVTTVNIPDDRIKKLHKQALKIAIRGMDLFPVTRRRSSTTVIALNAKQLQELHQMMDSFHKKLQAFTEHCAQDTDANELVQVAIHLTPVGGRHVT